MASKHMDADAAALLSFSQQRREAMVDTLRQMVELESPSDNKAAVDRLGEFLAQQFAAAGGQPKFHRQRESGNHLQVNFPGDDSRRPVMLLGHFDTVWALGTLAKMPWRVEEGRAWGPGSYDMKAGITQMLHALIALREVRGRLPRPVTVLLNTDEEVGSHTSRATIEKLARESTAVLIMEPSAGLKGAVKTARKGVGEYCLKASGVPAHAGISPQEGASAILELARQILKVSGFTDVKRGISVNAGVVEGGTRSNVVAAEASALIDVRIARVRDAAYIDRKLHALRPANRKCRIELTGGINRLPMERTKGVAELYGKAREVAARIHWKLEEASTGGASDGNFTAALGVPTLDGLGAVGEGAHAFNESVIIEEFPRRAALIAMLIEAA